jgi:endonuclease/exonuclease/phosphatase family metal-dependent hydrolase
MRPLLPTLPCLALVGAALTSCAPATNYLDPDGPRYIGGRADVPAHDSALRIVSYNIAYARQYERAIGCLREEPLRGADVLLLQEMNARAVEAMAEALGMHFVYYPASVRPGQNDMGSAILSPWPIEEARKLVLPHTSRVVHRARIATVATVQIEGAPVRVYSLHLTSPFGASGRTRGDQAEAVLADARGWSGAIIIGGDMNSHSVGKRFERAGFRWLTKSIGRTVGPFSFDHVYVRGIQAPSEAGVAHSCRGTSDHSPVWASLR